MKKIVFVTNNTHKLREIRAILGKEYEVLSLKDINCNIDIPETGETLEENAVIKAQYVYQNYGFDCFADDTGLEVEVLNGKPGVHTARFAYSDHNDPEANKHKLLQELEGEHNRKARFRTCIALIEKGNIHLFEGIVNGFITTEERGTEGFGYDPVFSPEKTGKTFAELGEDIKNHISHRARAVTALVEYLDK